MGLKAVTRSTSGGGGAGTVTQVDTGTGLTGGPITVSGTIALADTAVTPGTYGDATHVGRFTVDQQGRLTAASSVAITDTGITQLTGDGTAGPGSGSQAFTLATVNSNVGTFGDAANVAQVTLNGKGLVTAGSSVAISITPTQAGLSNVTNDAQTKAAIVPNTAPAAGRILVGNAGGTAYAPVAMSGDSTLASTGALTLATVNSNVGSFGDASNVATFTVTGKGLLTAAGSASITAPAGALTGTTLNATVVTSSLTAVGTITTGVWSGTAIGVTKGGTGLTSASQGDLIYGSAANTFSLLAKDTNSTRYLSNTGSSNNPAWAQIALTTGVTGALPAANGGTGVANNAASTITISGNFGTTLTVTGTTGVTLPTTGTLATLAGAETLTNKRINPRITTLSTAAATPTLTALGDTSDEVDMTVTSSTTTVTFGAPSGTPVNGQKLIFRVQCTNAQTYAYNGIFVGSVDVPLPTAASGSSKYDLLGFIYNDTSSKWQLAAKTFGF